MLKVVAFMKQVAEELRMGKLWYGARISQQHQCHHCLLWGRGFFFDEVTPEWLKGFEIHLRGRDVAGTPFPLI